MTGPRGGVYTRSRMAGSDLSSLGDEKLIGAARSSRDAFDELVRRWRPQLLAFARSVLRDGSLAEDAVQDCLLNTYRALASYEERGNFRAFLFKILRNCCLKLREKEARARARRVRVPPPTGAPQGCEPKELRRVLDELPGELREAVTLRVVEEMDYAQAAAALGEHPDTVRKRVYRALEILRRRIGH